MGIDRLIVRSLLWLINSVKRHPWRWLALFLLWLLWQVSLAVAVARFFGWIANLLGSSVANALMDAYNWLFRSPSRPWWLALTLCLFFPPVGWFLLSWLIWDACRPGPQVNAQTEFRPLED